MSEQHISKSKYLCGLQCPKLLWYHYHAKEQIPQADPATMAKFSQGEQVGLLAQQLFPNGIVVKWDSDMKEVLKTSGELLKQRKPLFEAGFASNRTYARVDVLDPVGTNEWDIIEVKMGTGVKDQNLDDVALQCYCYEGAGLKIRRCFLMYINNKYVRHGEVDPAGLFVREDITDAVDERLTDIESHLAQMFQVIDSEKCPAQDIGPHCDVPYACVMKDICWKAVRSHACNVFSLPNMRGKQWRLYQDGIVANNDIPADFDLPYHAAIQVIAEKTGKAHVDKDAVVKFLKTVKYPLYYLDFETFGLSVPIPLIDGTRPYQHVPFQYSLHVQDAPGVEPVHHSWIWDGVGDPRPELMKRLKGLLGEAGTIMVFNDRFEKGRLRDCAQFLPEYASWVHGLEARFVDLLKPFSSRAMYHPKQHGTASLKAVLPGFTELTYKGMEIAEGGAASDEFVRVTFMPATEEDRAKVFKNLEKYCGLDTMAMVRLVAKMREAANTGSTSVD